MTYAGIQWVPIETSFNPQIGVAPAGPVSNKRRLLNGD